MARFWGIFIYLYASTIVHADVVSNCTNLITNAALTATGTGPIVDITTFNERVDDLDAFMGMSVAANNSGTLPTLALKIQTCRTQSASTCYDTPIVFDACTTGSCYVTGSQRIDINKTTVNMFPYFRAVYTLGGTTPSYNINVDICYR